MSNVISEKLLPGSASMIDLISFLTPSIRVPPLWSSAHMLIVVSTTNATSRFVVLISESGLRYMGRMPTAAIPASMARRRSKAVSPRRDFPRPIPLLTRIKIVVAAITANPAARMMNQNCGASDSTVAVVVLVSRFSIALMSSRIICAVSAVPGS